MRSPCKVIVTVAALVAANGSALARSTQPTPVQSPPNSASQQESCPNVEIYEPDVLSLPATIRYTHELLTK